MTAIRRDQSAPMLFAYADPPYYNCCKLYQHHHPDGRCWDDLLTLKLLIEDLMDTYRDGWAMSLSTPSLREILPLCPPGVRVAAWTKPFAAYKRSVRVAYAWEPVIVYGGRISSKDGAMVNRDFLAEPITMKKGLTGAKPERVCRWILDLLGFKPGDTVEDLYPGTGVFGRVVLAAQASPEVLR